MTMSIAPSPLPYSPYRHLTENLPRIDFDPERDFWEQAQDALDRLGLSARSWRLKKDNSKGYAGRCSYTRREITISIYNMEIRGPEATWGTVLHEIAHALTPNAEHGPEWRRVCLALGGTGRTSVVLTAEERRREVKIIKWRGVCTKNPEHVIYRHRLTEAARLGACAHGSHGLNEYVPFTWIDQRA